MLQPCRMITWTCRPSRPHPNVEASRIVPRLNTLPVHSTFSDLTLLSITTSFLGIGLHRRIYPLFLDFILSFTVTARITKLDGMHGTAGYRMAFSSICMGAFYLQNNTPGLYIGSPYGHWERRLGFFPVTRRWLWEFHCVYSAFGPGNSFDQVNNRCTTIIITTFVIVNLLVHASH